MIELIERFQREELVFAADVVLHDGIQFRADDQMQRILVLFKRKVEASIFVGFRRQRLGLLTRVVEWVIMAHVVFRRLRFHYCLVGEIMIDERGFQSQSSWKVDRLLVAFGSFEWCVGSVFVHADHIE